MMIKSFSLFLHDCIYICSIATLDGSFSEQNISECVMVSQKMIFVQEYKFNIHIYQLL